MWRLRTFVKVTQQGDTRAEIFQFSVVNNVTVNRSFDNLTQTAKVVLPRNFTYKNNNVYEGANPMFKRGDKIELFAGYHPNLDRIFIGYISKINNNVPVEILCEDEMFLLKQKQVTNMSFKSMKLKDFINKIIGEDHSALCIDATLPEMRLQNVTVGKVLQTLRDQFGLYSFFIDQQSQRNILRVGLAYYPNEAVEYTFLFERDMIKDGMNLTYLKKDDVKVQVKGIIITDNDVSEPVIYGDETGETRTVFQYGGNREQLDITCNSFLEQANYTGYYGDFLTFLQPKVLPGDYAVIDSYKFPERKGKYLIKAVETSFGVNGGRQKIELERKIA